MSLEFINESYDGTISLPETESRELKGARLLLKHREPSAALMLVIHSLNKNSTSVSAMSLLVETQIRMGHRDLAIKAQEIKVFQTDNFEDLVTLGELYYLNGQDELASDCFEQALAKMIYSSEALFKVYRYMGNILLKEGDIDSAEEFFSKAFSINPKSDILQVNFGTLAVQVGNLEFAQEKFKEALFLNPKNDKAWTGLGLVYHAKGDHFLAIANLENSFEINSRNRTTVQLLSSWYVQEGKLQSAIEVVEVYMRYFEDDKEMALFQVNLLCQTNQFLAALMELERLLLWDPKNEEYLRLYNEVQVYL
ncbi:MAG: tetratricopeptide repeat protein [Proteobacteria bacterium]|jgi:tetratricopeptide (TPR) repeat protein|nr:tetratricopeptide repeat protein [Pseudomonadota bacterium]